MPVGLKAVGAAAVGALLWAMPAQGQALNAAPAAVVLPDAPQAAAATVRGTVVDADGDLIPGARVRLESAGLKAPLETTADERGGFSFAGVPAGAFTLTVKAEGFAVSVVKGTAAPGQAVEVAAVALSASADMSVDAMTTREMAEIQVKQEEHQRLLGVIPNFGISYDWSAAPMSTGQKYRMATRFVVDPFNLAYAAAQAGIEQATGTFSGYGPGWAGYGKRYGAALADLFTDNELGGAVYPALFHQDPRYFWKGRGTVLSRTWYAVSQAVLCRGDNGHTQFNVSGIAGFMTAGAISNLYYPAENRSDGILTLENAGLGLAAGAVGNVVQEFFLKALTPNAKKIKANTTGMAQAQTAAAVRGTKVRLR
jgi:hypothetical protein